MPLQIIGAGWGCTLGQGWQPLRAFLGRPVPDQPFRHVNDRAACLGRR